MTLELQFKISNAVLFWTKRGWQTLASRGMISETLWANMFQGKKTMYILMSVDVDDVSYCQGPATMITQPWLDALALERTLKSTGFDSVELRNAALKNWLRTCLLRERCAGDNFVCPMW